MFTIKHTKNQSYASYVPAFCSESQLIHHIKLAEIN